MAEQFLNKYAMDIISIIDELSNLAKQEYEDPDFMQT